MAMRIELWVAQLCGDALFEPFRDEMFKALRFFVNLFERVVQDFEKKGFDETMMAQHLKGPPFTCR